MAVTFCDVVMICCVIIMTFCFSKCYDNVTNEWDV